MSKLGAPRTKAATEMKKKRFTEQPNQLYRATKVIGIWINNNQ